MSLIPEEIFINFRDWLTNSGLAWNQSLRDWTSGIKEFFEQLANDRYKVIYSREGVTEYLVDLVWKVETPNRYLALVLESELSEVRREIIKDFEKLVDIKSKIKIGIFRSNSRSEITIVKDMRKILTSHMIPFASEVYIIIFLNYNRDEGKIYINCHYIDCKGMNLQENGTHDCIFQLDVE